jgi:hypothetical protein
MTLNPVTALSEQFQKLITEHGSATILRDHLALLKDQVVLLEKKAASLESENAILKSENAALKTENSELKSEAQNLAKENTELATKIEVYENVSQSASIDDIKVKILLFLSTLSDGTDENRVASKCNLVPQSALFHLEELEEWEMVHGSYSMAALTEWSLVQKGRRYLIERNLL